MRLFLLFTLVPALELYLLVTIGGMLGPLPTIGLVILTGLVGAALAKREGLRVLRSWQEASARGELPKDGVISSLLVLVGGVLLVTPGVVTDIVGLALLVPPARRLVADQLRTRLSKRLEIQTFSPQMFGAAGFSPAGSGGPAPDDDVIDVEAHDAQSGGDEPPAGDDLDAEADEGPRRALSDRLGADQPSP